MTLTRGHHPLGQHHSSQASIALGDGNPKLGRAKIIQTARNFGIWTPLPDTPSLPIVADEVNVLRARGRLRHLSQSRQSGHAACRARGAHRHRRPGVAFRPRRQARPEQVISPKVALDMIAMMNSVVQNGTGRRAQARRRPKVCRARPAPPTAGATPGSSATPEISAAPYGWAMTITRRQSV